MNMDGVKKKYKNILRWITDVDAEDSKTPFEKQQEKFLKAMDESTRLLYKKEALKGTIQ